MNWPNPPDLRGWLLQILPTSCFMESPLSNMTPRLRAELQKHTELWLNLKIWGKVEEQCFSLISVQLKIDVDGPLLFKTNTVLHVAEKSQCWSNDLNCTTTWCRTEWCSTISDCGCVYRMKRSGPSTEPWGMPIQQRGWFWFTTQNRNNLLFPTQIRPKERKSSQTNT